MSRVSHSINCSQADHPQETNCRQQCPGDSRGGIRELGLNHVYACRYLYELNAVVVAKHWRRFIVHVSDPSWKVVSLKTNAAGLLQVHLNLAPIRIPSNDLACAALRLDHDSGGVW